MKTLPLAGGALLLAICATGLPAQQEADSRPDPTACMQKIEAEADRLRAEWPERKKELMAEIEKAKAEGQKRIRSIPSRPDLSELRPMANGFAADFAGTPEAVPFLLWSIKNTGFDMQALRTLLADHRDDDRIAEVGPMLTRLYPMLARLPGNEISKDVLDSLATSKSANVRGWGLMIAHKQTIEEADRDGDVYQTARKALMETCAAATDDSLKQQITAMIELRENFGVGCTAPDIEGEDLDGVAFKLSDYRGKVIFLDFWGDW
jgi:hypothetical protein